MIKARLHDDKIILGLEREHIDRMIEGQPIKIDHRMLGDTKCDVYLVYGRTVEQVVKHFRDTGKVVAQCC